MIASATPLMASDISAGHPWLCPSEDFDRVVVAARSAGAQWVEWAAPRQSGDLLFACDGCVYRLENWKDQEPSDYLGNAAKIADFSAEAFTLLRPPAEAMRW